MNEYVIVTDSSCDLPDSLIKQMNIEVIPLSILVGEKIYRDYADEREIKYSEVYRLLRNNHEIQISTSAINTDYFAKSIEHILIKGKDVLYLGFSASLSSTYNNGKLAITELQAKYPNNKLISVDSCCGSLGQGMLVYLAYLEKEKGKSIDEVVDFVNDIKMSVCHWFTVDDLNHLKRGGRISGATARIGTMLNIKPILKLDNDCKLTSAGKARGRKTSLDMLFDKAKNHAINPSEQVMFISHGDCIEDVKYLARRLKNELHVKKIFVNYTGPVVGVHAGPDAIGLFFLSDSR